MPLRVLLAAVWALAAAAPGLAQIAMPDARQMSGIPRPVDDLPDRTISVRLIRGDLSNNIADHPVELYVDGRPQTVPTGQDGRAQFGPIPPGATIKAVAVVDGERLESLEFPSPRQGGIRLMLVATSKDGAETAGSATATTKQAPMTGSVVLGGESRIVMEVGDEVLRVFYVLEILNAAPAPVNTEAPFIFETPTGALSTTVMEGSSPLASATGTRVRVQGPFPPGTTPVEVGFVLPAPSGSLDIEQRFPVRLERIGIVVENVGGTVLTSPQIERQQEMPLGERTYIAAAAGSVTAGDPLVISVTGLPHHSATPRFIALGLAAAIVAVGLWTARRPTPPAARSDRKRLTARREKLLQDLVGLETDHRRGRVDAARYALRREAIVAALEQVYGALDTDDTSPGPASRPGLAA